MSRGPKKTAGRPRLTFAAKRDRAREGCVKCAAVGSWQPCGEIWETVPLGLCSEPRLKRVLVGWRHVCWWHMEHPDATDVEADLWLRERGKHQSGFLDGWRL